MASKTPPESNAAARRRLTEEMLRLEDPIDREVPGSPHRLELLREQAGLSDERERLRSGRP